MVEQNKTATTANSDGEEKAINDIINVLRANNLTFYEARVMLHKVETELDNLTLYARV